MSSPAANPAPWPWPSPEPEGSRAWEPGLLKPKSACKLSSWAEPGNQSETSSDGVKDARYVPVRLGLARRWDCALPI
jgi:hypothetical protein